MQTYDVIENLTNCFVLLCSYFYFLYVLFPQLDERTLVKQSSISELLVFQTAKPNHTSQAERRRLQEVVVHQEGTKFKIVVDTLFLKKQIGVTIQIYPLQGMLFSECSINQV